MAIARQGLTLDEFLALPEEKPALEHVDGVVTQKVAPKFEHSVLQDQIGWDLNRQLRPRGRARVLPELRATYGGRSYVPDISVYRRERLPRRTPGQPVGELLIPLDLGEIAPGLHLVPAAIFSALDPR
jgi:Uma2 family endonuclease